MPDVPGDHAPSPSGRFQRVHILAESSSGHRAHSDATFGTRTARPFSRNPIWSSIGSPEDFFNQYPLESETAQVPAGSVENNMASGPALARRSGRWTFTQESMFRQAIRGSMADSQPGGTTLWTLSLNPPPLNSRTGISIFSAG